MMFELVKDFEHISFLNKKRIELLAEFDFFFSKMEEKIR